MRMLTVAKAAEATGLSPHTIYKYIEQSRIPYARIGRRVLLDEDVLRDWVSERSVSTPAKDIPSALRLPADVEASLRGIAGEFQTTARQVLAAIATAFVAQRRAETEVWGRPRRTSAALPRDNSGRVLSGRALAEQVYQLHLRSCRAEMAVGI